MGRTVNELTGHVSPGTTHQSYHHELATKGGKSPEMRVFQKSNLKRQLLKKSSLGDTFIGRFIVLVPLFRLLRG